LFSQSDIASRSEEPTLSRTILQIVREPVAGERYGRRAASAALAVASGSSYSWGFCSDWPLMNAIGVLAMDHRQEAVLRKLCLAPVGNGDFRRALHVDATVVGREAVRRQVLDRSADSMPRIREHQPYSLND
jgi:hypothetical protein